MKSSYSDSIAIVLDVVFFSFILQKLFGDDLRIVGGLLFIREAYVILTFRSRMKLEQRIATKNTPTI